MLGTEPDGRGLTVSHDGEAVAGHGDLPAAVFGAEGRQERVAVDLDHERGRLRNFGGYRAVYDEPLTPVELKVD
ncbi:hypothetical protein DB30_01306 [Enhygromyxa salina]|uniref:Uncharacterized protein n=1 Tax=Enhygromyxa salina TaxID=215803 RepID=A0A0C1Z493_9BACT|nr:hypothetical protein DB30_01306 [Enhygromyxa salina]